MRSLEIEPDDTASKRTEKSKNLSVVCGAGYRNEPDGEEHHEYERYPKNGTDGGLQMPNARLYITVPETCPAREALGRYDPVPQ